MRELKNKILLIVVFALSVGSTALPSSSFLSRLFLPSNGLLTSLPVSAFKSVIYSQNSTFRDVMVLSALGFGFAPLAAAAPLLPVMAAAPFIKWFCLFSAVGRVAWSVDENGKDIKATRKNTETLIGKADKTEQKINNLQVTTDNLSQDFGDHRKETSEHFGAVHNQLGTLQQTVVDNQTHTDKRFDQTDTQLSKVHTCLETVNTEVKQVTRETVIISGSVAQLTQKIGRADSESKKRDDDTQQKVAGLQKQTQNLNEGVSNLRADFALLNTTVTQNDQKLHGRIDNMEKKADAHHQETTKKIVETATVMNKLLDRNQELQDEQLAIQEQIKELSKGQRALAEGQQQNKESLNYLVSFAQKQEQVIAHTINRKSSAITAFDFVTRNN